MASRHCACYVNDRIPCPNLAVSGSRFCAQHQDCSSINPNPSSTREPAKVQASPLPRRRRSTGVLRPPFVPSQRVLETFQPIASSFESIRYIPPLDYPQITPVRRSGSNLPRPVPQRRSRIEADLPVRRQAPQLIVARTSRRETREVPLDALGRYLKDLRSLKELGGPSELVVRQTGEKLCWFFSDGEPSSEIGTWMANFAQNTPTCSDILLVSDMYQVIPEDPTFSKERRRGPARHGENFRRIEEALNSLDLEKNEYVRVSNLLHGLSEHKDKHLMIIGPESLFAQPLYRLFYPVTRSVDLMDFTQLNVRGYDEFLVSYLKGIDRHRNIFIEFLSGEPDQLYSAIQETYAPLKSPEMEIALSAFQPEELEKTDYLQTGDLLFRIEQWSQEFSEYLVGQLVARYDQQMTPLTEDITRNLRSPRLAINDSHYIYQLAGKILAFNTGFNRLINDAYILTTLITQILAKDGDIAIIYGKADQVNFYRDILTHLDVNQRTIATFQSGPTKSSTSGSPLALPSIPWHSAIASLEVAFQHNRRCPTS